MEELHGHTLEYWKNNAEEDYLKVPISVLKYITCLEERIEQLTIPVVVRQSEQLVCSCGSIKVQTTGGSQCPNNRCSSAN